MPAPADILPSFFIERKSKRMTKNALTVSASFEGEPAVGGLDWAFSFHFPLYFFEAAAVSFGFFCFLLASDKGFIFLSDGL